MHQIVQFQPYVNRAGETKTRQVFLPVQIDELDKLFDNPEQFLSTLPDEGRVNSYYTVAKRKENDREVTGFIRQDHLAFDVDDIDITKEEETARVAVAALGLRWEDVAVVASGHGVQFIIRLTKPIEDPLFFDSKGPNKAFYNGCCAKIDAALKASGLKGHGDRTIFDQARVLRPPNTWNVKPGKERRMARMLKSGMTPLAFDLKAAAGLPDIQPGDAIGMSFPEPDTKAILDTCEFLKWGLENQNKVDEPMWYAIASVVGRFKDGRKLFHKFSEKYKGYDRLETENKLDQALANSGPRTCKNIDQIWGKCSTCKVFGKCKSPILIIGPDYIKTKDTGFRHTKYDPQTREITGMSGIDIEDLVKWFEKSHQFKVDVETETVYGFKDTHYEEITRAEIKGFAEKWATKCMNKDAVEFFAKILRKKIVPKTWFRSDIDGYMNFKNGVLNVKTLEFKPSTSEMGFRSVLPYSYDPLAKAPRFEQFLDEITCGNEGFKKTLLEFSGYSLSNDRYWDHKALLLIGHGSNGKSTFVQTLCSLAEGSYSGVRTSQFGNDQMLARLDGKLFNVSEESGKALDTESFKLVASGGLVSAKVVYKPSFEFYNKAKIIALLNNPPTSEDTSHGFLRRCAFVEFNARFSGENMDPFLADKLLAERPGILNLMLAAYREMLERGKCYMDAKSDEYLANFSKEMNPVAMWIDDNIQITKNQADFVSTRDMYANYVGYCEAGNYKVLTLINFTKELKRQSDGLKEGRTAISRGFTFVRLLSDSLKPNVDTPFPDNIM